MNKNRVKVGVAAFALAVAAAALAQQKFEFRNKDADKDGGLVVTNPGGTIKGTRVQKDPEQWKIVMRSADNSPILAVWKEQGITLRSRLFEALTEKAGQRTELLTAHLGGGVTATTLRPSSKVGATSKQTVTLTSPTMDFFGEENRAELKGGVTVDQKDPAAETSMTARGNSGTVVLTDAEVKGAKGPIDSAVLVGSAKITLNSMRMVTEGEKGKPRVRVKRPFDIVLTGDRVQFQLSKSGEDYGTITVTGSNVTVTGNDSAVIGNITGVKKLVIKLDSDKQPYDIDSSGEPGSPTVTKLSEKKGG